MRPPTWPARSDTIRAAEAQVEAARAALPQAEWELAQKTRQVREDAMVVDTFFEPGEWVAAGRPSLLPPGNIKVRFYVPEEALGTLAIGDPLELRCDHCPEDLRVEVSYISAEAEYTPPVIYSRETRDKLVYRIEARPDLRADAHYALHALIQHRVTLEACTQGATPRVLGELRDDARRS